MLSKYLYQAGLVNVLGGIDYNFRSTVTGEAGFQNQVEQLCREVGIHPDAYYMGQQVHEDQISYAEAGEHYAGGYLLADTDGLITDQKGIGLIIKFADCTPIILFDPVKKVQALIHSGWRGTVQKIGLKALEKMQTDFDCELDNIHVYLGPSIAQEDYEVGEDVYKAFKVFKFRDQVFKPFEEKYLLDNQYANQLMFEEFGINAAQIEMSDQNTFQDLTLHSARREGKDYGLNAIMTVMI